MKLKFNGIMQKKHGGGCSRCGRKASSENKMMTSKMFILPSGKSVTFYVNREVEVSDSDGQFLLGYKYEKDGETHSAFTRTD